MTPATTDADYIAVHGLAIEASLGRAVNQVILERAADPVGRIGELLVQAVGAARRPAIRPTASPDAGGAWTALGWILSLAPDMGETIAGKLLPSGADDEFSVLRGLSDAEFAARLGAAGLSGLVPVVTKHAALLRGQEAATGAELNHKFSSEQGTFQLAFGSLETFYQGLGTPQVALTSHVFSVAHRGALCACMAQRDWWDRPCSSTAASPRQCGRSTPRATTAPSSSPRPTA